MLPRRASARILKQNKPSDSAGASAAATGTPTAGSGSGPLDKYLIARNSSKRKQCWLTPPENEEHQMLEEQQQASKRRQQYHIQNQWRPITDCDRIISTRTLVPSPIPPTSEVPCHEAMLASGASCYSFRNIFTCQSSRCPLPPLKWGDSQDVWNVMKAKDKKYIRDKELIHRHPQLQYRMRAILLDWIIEVCEVYRLHRETFYLATDFIDRYMSQQRNIQKYQLQLIGVTALFIAAKLEEIYPPKIGEFAYVTDGACTEDDITKQELIMLKTLKWDLCPMTVNTWTTIYLNILTNSDNSKTTSLTSINYSRRSFLSLTRLSDLVMLDEGSLAYPYGVLAASILYHFGNDTTTEKASGYKFEELESCVNWMAPFAITIRDRNEPNPKVKEFDNVMEEDHHNIQTHDITIETLDRAKSRQREMTLASSRASPELLAEIPDVLTPPPTKHKHSAAASSKSPTSSGSSSNGSTSGVSLVEISSSEGELSNDSTSSTLTAVAEVLSSPTSLENLHL